MRGAERIVFALGALGEAGQAAALAQRADAVAAAGEDLVRIGLVADVPDQPVVRRVEHVMQRDRQLDHAEAGAEMAAGHGNGVDRLLAQFVGDLPQLARFEAPEVVRGLDEVEQRGLGGNRHAYAPFYRPKGVYWGSNARPVTDALRKFRCLYTILGRERNFARTGS